MSKFELNYMLNKEDHRVFVPQLFYHIMVCEICVEENETVMPRIVELYNGDLQENTQVFMERLGEIVLGVEANINKIHNIKDVIPYYPDPDKVKL